MAVLRTLVRGRSALDSCLEPPTHYAQQVAAVTQENCSDSGDVLQVAVVGVFQFGACEAFDQLSDGQQARGAVGVEYVQGGGFVDEQAGDGAVDAGDGDVLMSHGEGSVVE